MGARLNGAPSCTAGNHNNLFSNIVLGAGSRPFDSSGDAGRGAHAGECSAAGQLGRWFLHAKADLGGALAARMPAHLRSHACAAGTYVSAPLLPAAPAAANNTWWNIQSASGTVVLPLPSCDYGALETFVLGNVGPPAKGDWGVGPVVRAKSLAGAPNKLAVGVATAAGADAGVASPAGVGPNAMTDAAAAARPYSLFPGYCASRVGWWVEQVRPGAALNPPDLHYAMVATRGQRLPGRQARR